MGEELLWATKNGDLEKVKSVSGFDPNQEFGGRPLMLYAADYGQVEVIEYLVSKGGKVNCADKHGITPLLAAIFEGHTDCVKVLLGKGADKNVKTPDGLTCLECAETDAIKELLK